METEDTNLSRNGLEHLICNPCKNVPQVNIYTSSVNLAFTDFHRYLIDKVGSQGDGTLIYSLRYKPVSQQPQGGSSSPLYLTGYGVELALKNTDYLVIDDRTSTQAKDDQEKDDNSGIGAAGFIKQLGNMGKKVNQVLFETNGKSTIEPLTPDEIKLLGLKATQFIMASKDPLATLTQLSQDFPKYAHKISTVKLKDDLTNEIISNQRRFVKAGANALWINGRKLEDNEINPFSIARDLHREMQLVKSLVKLGGTRQQAIRLISSKLLSAESSKPMDGALQDVYDVRVPTDEPVVIWWNDLESDKRYKDWRRDLSALLQPTYPGQMRAIGRNIYNVLMVENLASSASLQRLTNEVQNMIQHGAPLRFGIVPYLGEVDSPASLAAKALQHLTKQYGKRTGMIFLTQLQAELAEHKIDYATEDNIFSAFEKTSAHNDTPFIYTKAEWPWIKNESQNTGVVQFLRRMGINQLEDDQGVLFMNGQYMEHSSEKPWTRLLMGLMNIQTQMLTRSVYLGEINDDDNVYDFFLNQPYVSSSRNAYVAVSDNRPLLMSGAPAIRNSVDKVVYLDNGSGETVTTNILAVGNMNSPAGIKLALNAIQYVENNNQTRLSILHVPSMVDPTKDEDTEFSDVLYHELYDNNIDLENAKKLLEMGLLNKLKSHWNWDGKHWKENEHDDDKHSERVIKSKFLTPGSPVVEFSIRKNAFSKWLTLALMYIHEENGSSSWHFTNAQDQHLGLIVNGRIIGPLADEGDFTVDDFEALWQFENTQRVTPMVNALQQVEWPMDVDGISSPDIITLITALVNDDKSRTTRNILLSEEDTPVREMYYAQMSNDHSGIYINRNDKNGKDGVYAEIGILLDPVSEDAQKWSTILEVLSKLEGVAIDIRWNPIPQLEELPLKRFYRYVLDSAWHFNDDENETHQHQMVNPSAYFDDLPVDALYTLGVDTIDAWHVTVKDANVDLDNIQLATLAASSEEGEREGVHAVYELERILVEGHCLDSTDQRPPRGLQFVLGTESHPAMTDTIVMANLGYFQLKAQPGIYQLRVRPGRSSQVYGIESIGSNGNWIKKSSSSSPSQQDNSATTPLILTSFEGLRLFPTVKKHAGMETADVLDDESTGNAPQGNEGILSSLSNKLFGKKDDTGKAAATTQKQADINIFSVASGHLYERFLAIMMASVMENTNSTVKFWFIENFLSPSFKDFVPELSKQYGFDYEMVTYKWPSWLNAQKEKQRTIWGYKILFLDVLFPLDLDKVIFVDADQIVRTDLQELVDLNLHGAPYGYTPFCSDRHEMDGFRFWSQGYWKDHLRGRPYHISALYVVDLVRFRQMAAGDRLRAQYQQLSADPNSLANLDQDLPNNMIHSVPIFSLPQEWLWCETWCSDESLKKAKTIDLCNNPLTKEPKLDRARRQVPEWETYDEQIESIRQTFLQHKTTGKHTTILDDKRNPTSKIESNHIKDEL
ncbi:unnamed protein product [Absidia cylindrospora]